jgi:hypothetical protein
MSRRNPYLALEAKIAAGARGDAIYRWRFGRQLVKDKAGRQQLPHGLAADLIAAATRAGYKLSEREIRYRLACAEVYSSEAEVGTAVQTFGSWTALRDAGFPPVQSTDLEDLEAAGIPTGPPDAFEQLTLIPGMPDELKIRGRKIPLAAATVADAKAYRDMYRDMHESFGKTLAQVEMSVEAMVDGSDGDDTANAVEAWKRATG